MTIRNNTNNIDSIFRSLKNTANFEHYFTIILSYDTECRITISIVQILFKYILNY